MSDHKMWDLGPLTNTRALDIMILMFPLCGERAKILPSRGWLGESALKAVESHAVKWKNTVTSSLNGLGPGERSRCTLFQQTQIPISTERE